MHRVLVLLFLPLAAAFASMPPADSPHDKITSEAAEAVEWPAKGIAALQEAVRAPDVQEFRTEPQPDDPGRIDAADAFQAAHHCDRVPPADDLTAFAETQQYIRHQRAAAAQAMTNGSAEEAVRHMGSALHALQDCFSHSNYVDLDAGAQERFVRALLEGGSAPGSLRLTGFEPDADDPGHPDDPYPHDEFAKDGPDFNAEAQQTIGNMTKYRMAHEAAVQASAAVMAAFLGPLEEAQRRQLADLRPSDGVAESVPVASWLVMAGVGAAAMVRRK